jgi:sugar lactone lactonase YvrE
MNTKGMNGTSRLQRISAALTSAACLAGAILIGSPVQASAQTAPAYTIYSQTLLTPFNGIFGAVVSDKFGNVFVNSGGDSVVYEYPANGGPRIVIFDATATGPQTSGVAIDANNNLYVTTRYDGSVSGTETDIFEFPFVNGAYPGPYKYSGSAAQRCGPTITGVCNYGQFLTTAGGYYQPQAIAFDGSGNGYLITTYDSYSGGGKTIFACDTVCAIGAKNSTIAVDHLPTIALSLAAASNGDLYWADGTDVYFSKAGSGSFSIFDTFYENQFGGAEGVSFDRAGNLYVTSSQGTFEVPLVNGVIAAGTRFLLVSGYGAQAGAGITPNGDIYAANFSQLYQNLLFNGNFGGVAIGTAATPIAYTVQSNSSAVIQSLTAMEGNTAATEFAVTGDTCTGTSPGIGGTCGFNVTFTPTGIGTRRGTVVLTDSQGNVSNLFVTGQGQGTGVAIDPGTPTAVSSTLQAPSGIAVDHAGNIFVADATAKSILEYVGGTGTPVTIANNLTKPTGVAVDGSGSLYVVDQGANTLTLYTNTAGVFSATGAVLTSSLKAPTDVVVSGTGLIYVSNSGNNEVLSFPNASRIGSAVDVSSLGSGLIGPTGLALDSGGNIYIADTGNNRVVQLSLSGGQSSIGTGLNAPTGVAVEASGSVLIADQGNGRILRVPNSAGALNSSGQITLGQPLVAPYSIRLDSLGTLYASDNTAGAVESLQRTAGTLNFGISNVSAASSSQTVIISSTGTSALTLGSPLYTPVPPASDFTLTEAGSSPCASGTLLSGIDCTLSSVFTPDSLGVKTYPVTFNVTAANAATTSITLTGTGVDLQPVTASLTVSPTSVTYGTTVTLTTTVTSASGTSTATPTGSVVFNVDGSNTKPIILVNGQATTSLTGLNAGSSHSITATYQGSTIYASGNSNTATFVVQPGTTTGVLTIVGDNSTPLSVSPLNPVSFSVAITDSVVGDLSGTVSFISGNTVLATSQISQVQSTPANNGTIYTAGLSLTLPAGVYQVQAVFNGNGNYTGFTTPVQTLTVVLPSFAITSDAQTLTASATQYGIANLTVSSYSAFQAAVDLSCSGLPANAYCIFRPGLISLTTVGTSILPQSTQMQIRVDQNPTNIKSASSFAVLGMISGVLLFLGFARRRNIRSLGVYVLLCLLGTVSIGLTNGCGSPVSNSLGSTTNFKTPAGTYNITLNAVATPLTSSGGAVSPFSLTYGTFQSSTIGSACTTPPPPTPPTPPPPPVCTAASTATSGVATVFTNGSTGYQVGQSILVNGLTDNAFNGTFTITSVTDYTVLPTASNPNATSIDQITYNIMDTSSHTATGGSLHTANVTSTQNFTLVVQ